MAEATRAATAAAKRTCPHCGTPNAVQTMRADKQYVYGRCKAIGCGKESKRRKLDLVRQ